MKQSTIARPIEWRGLGLHSGAPVRVALSPAAADSGIVFCRPCDRRGEEIEIPACYRSVHSTSRATTLSADSSQPLARGDAKTRVSTVEHLLATLYAFEIDNVRIRVEGPEVPAMDGSALPLVERVRAAGRVLLAADRKLIRLKESIEIREGDRWIRADPADRFQVTYSVDFDHPLIGCQRLEISNFDAELFSDELAAARTFAFSHEVDALRASGLARGGSLDNTLVLDAVGILNGDGLRFDDEFVRHKVIDLLGDLALLGSPLHAHVVVHKGGHSLHHRLVQAIAAEAEPFAY